MNQAAIEAITSRRSIRAFLPRPVPRATLLAILDTAARAPSGSNIQPWKLHALTGAALARLCDRLSTAHAAGEAPRREYQYYPRQWRSPYLERRRAVGWRLYELAGVQRGDREGGLRQEGRNYRFFGAPVGLVFTIDRDMEQGSWLDYGMFLQSVMVAARAHGLDTCPQAAFANYPHLLRDELGIPEGEMVVCGMALGWADPEAAVNRLASEREPATAFTTFHDS
ncbi:nitroreductase [Pseudoroseomonas cervicalis]|uniref:Nitroreductase family protein n=1 Tax=Pseudoroseomonas cervicalis ATCC 49957 TaxID=525371 RepID=D5RJH1_9PROT|nr:nitroreductase [Pseudoroseomonas cervicalis]EFH12537.1 nitroreductase family protein [Pseudoroseomonas cervicalis ATCC 49957]